MRCYRIVKPAYAATALTGEGARRYGGRWNPPGWRCVYTGGSRALAILELLVHLSPETRDLAFQLLELEMPDDLIAPHRSAPTGWNRHPAGEESQSHGLEWLQKNRFPVFAVPSVIVPQEMNYLLNPASRGFEEIRVIGESRFQLDLRLAERQG